MSSELLDQPVFAGNPLKLFICSTPRSGSYMLCRYMINAGLGVPHEYFNPITMRQMAPRLGLGEAVAGLQWPQRRGRLGRLLFGKPVQAAEEAFLRDYLAALMPRRCHNGIFAAKIQFEQFKKVLDNPTGRHLLDGGLFIHLFREDLLKQAVSTHFAQQTGRWGIDDTVTTKPAARPDFLDIAALDRTLQNLADEDRGWRVFLATNGLAPISISYEQLCKDIHGFLGTVAQRLGIDPDTLRHDYSEAGLQVESDSAFPDKAEVARHYVAARGMLQRFAHPPRLRTDVTPGTTIRVAGE